MRGRYSKCMITTFVAGELQHRYFKFAKTHDCLTFPKLTMKSPREESESRNIKKTAFIFLLEE